MASVEQVQGSETTADEVVNTVVEEGARLGVKRFFTIPGRDPFDEIEWETRDAVIPGRDGPAYRARAVQSSSHTIGLPRQASMPAAR